MSFELLHRSLDAEKIVSRKLAIALSVAVQLRKSLRRNLLAIGVCGSVARGTAEKYSDVDLLVLVRKLKPDSTPFRIFKDTMSARSTRPGKAFGTSLQAPLGTFQKC